MPGSYGFANGAVHVLEGRFFPRERIERLLSAADEMEAVKILQEGGYGRGDEVATAADYERWLEKRVTEVYAFVRSVSPERAATDSYLLRVDYTNLKILCKAHFLSQKAEGILREGGVFFTDILVTAVRDQDYRRLTPPMQRALKVLHSRSAASALNPRAIDGMLDQAYFVDVCDRMKEVKSETIAVYFTDLTDLTNLRTALRARAMGMSREELREQFVEGGLVDFRRIGQIMEEPERATQAFIGRPFKYRLDEALMTYFQTGSLISFELFLDAHLLALIRQKQWSMHSVEPLVGYLLGVLREVAAIRLCMVGHINGFPVETIRERLGELYV